LHDVNGRVACDYSDNHVNFIPGSAALYFVEPGQKFSRPATSNDYQKYCRVVSRMENINGQSTAMVPSDIAEHVADSYRLYLSLMLCEKPVVTGAFRIESFEIMKNLQIAVRGSKEELKAKPLTVFSCCPTSPLKWSDVTSQNLIDCAEYFIPVELISMPMAGFISPVTLVGTLVQHTIESMSGLVIHQLASPGAPILWGGSPAIFDIRYETTPMGAVETMMIDCAYCEIGKYLKLPTQAYIAFSDAKHPDIQAGLESSMGATLAALAGINSISGPGMLDFENCFSLEKLVVDNEIAGMAYRMINGIEPKEDFPARPHFEELLAEKHLLISDHTRKYLKEEHYFPGPAIERANRERWKEEGALAVEVKAHNQVQKFIESYRPSSLPDDKKAELTKLMSAEAARFGMDKLPELLR
jgi:trimethylamine--corrinoid protein Co-methyltransferase